MKRDRRRTLRLERLESKALLSAVPGTQPVGSTALPGHTAGALGGTVVIPHSGLIAPNPGSTVTTRAGLHAITPLDASQFMMLSNTVSVGAAGEATVMTHTVRGSAPVAGGGVPHVIHVSPRGVRESAQINLSSIGTHEVTFGSSRVTGGLGVRKTTGVKD